MITNKSKLSILLVVVLVGSVFSFHWTNESLPEDCVINLDEQSGEIVSPKGEMSPGEFTAYRKKVEARVKLIDEKMRSGEMACS